MLKTLILTGVKMKALENKLDDLLVKKAPYKLPENFKKGLVTALPWLALAVGVLSLLGAWGLYGALSMLGAVYLTYAGTYEPLLWLSLALLVGEAVLLFMAFSPLKEKKKRGWDLMFWVSLVNAAYAVVYLIATPDPMRFVFSLLGTVIGLYLLFQVRSYYSGAVAK